MKVVDCRVCGDPNSVLRFAFVEFMDEGKLRNFFLEIPNESTGELGVMLHCFYFI